MATGSSRRPVTAVTAVAAVTAVLLTLTGAGLGTGALAATAADAAPASSEVTSQLEARRVDRVATPRLGWYDCSSIFGPTTQCATVALPLDYDEPGVATTDVAVLRVKATDQKHKIGTLFVNPGGPGGSGVIMAALARYFLAPSLLARFDIVGFDPRGTNFSSNVTCFANVAQQAKVLAPLSLAFPWTAGEKNSSIKASRALGKACSSTGKPLSASMSTAEVARDLDVLRRAVGDKKLSYLGFSYGTYLGQVYANLFPDRVRAVVIDGVLDPLAWAGTAANNAIPQTVRLKSGEASYRALHEILLRCRKTGPTHCGFAALGDPVAGYDKITAALRKAPLVITDPGTGQRFTVSYADLIGTLTGALYSPYGSAAVDAILTSVHTLVLPPPGAGTPAFARRAAAGAALVAVLQQGRSATAAALAARAQQAKAFGYSFPYNNALDAFQTVLCTDGLNPSDASKWPAYAAAAQKKAPGFGPLWAWSSAPCASKTWTVHDDEAYRGSFTHRTSSPLLVVGNYWDPATNYDGAVTASGLAPNSRLLSSDSWGHTAYGTSACVTDAVDRYLLTQRLPAKNTLCHGDVQPFTTPLNAPPPAAKANSAIAAQPLVPVLPGVPRW